MGGGVDPRRTTSISNTSGLKLKWATVETNNLSSLLLLLLLLLLQDMLIRGGENVYPREVEDVLHGHEAVAEVHVVGVPDQRLGEEVCAWIRLKPNHRASQQQLAAFCADKVLCHCHQLSLSFHFLFWDNPLLFQITSTVVSRTDSATTRVVD